MKKYRNYLKSIALGCGLYTAALGLVSLAQAETPISGDDTLRLAQQLVSQNADQIDKKIDASAYNNEPNLKLIFNNTYKNAIDMAVVYSIDTYSRPKTFLYTGGGTQDACRGPSSDNTPFPDMWIRDGSAALHSYLSIFKNKKLLKKYPAEENALKNIFRGFIYNIEGDLFNHPYEHSFAQDGSVNDSAKGFELDSPSYFIWLSYGYWQATGDKQLFLTADKDAEAPIFLTTLSSIVQTYKHFQRFQQVINTQTGISTDSRPIPYTGMVSTESRPSDDYAFLPFNIPDNLFAIEALQEISKMVPSIYNNTKFEGQAKLLATKSKQLAQQIQEGIDKYGTYQLNGKKIYAYEVGAVATNGIEPKSMPEQQITANGKTSSFPVNFPVFQSDPDQVTVHKPYPDTVFKQDPSKSVQIIHGDNTLIPGTDYQVLIDNTSGKATLKFLKATPKKGETFTIKGNYLIMDDANLPNLLSIPYFGGKNNHMYKNTRKAVINANYNHFYYQGGGGNNQLVAGEGSPHVQDFLKLSNYIWPLGQESQGLTAKTKQEKYQKLSMLLDVSSIAKPQCKNSQYYMYESFSADNPSQITRGWFVWANALFSEFVIKLVDH